MRFTAVVVLLLSITTTLGWHRYSRQKMHKPHQVKDYKHIMEHYLVMTVASCDDCNSTSELVELFDFKTNTSCYTGYHGLYNTTGVNFDQLVGAYVNREALVCGGDSWYYDGGPDIARTECYKYDPKEQRWGPAQEMREKRIEHAGIPLHDHQSFWVTGGSNYRVRSQADTPRVVTTEIYHDGYWSTGPNMPYPLIRHCMVNINDNETALVGGQTDYQEEGDILIWNWNTWTWRCGPRFPGDFTLATARCGLLHKEGTNPLVVITANSYAEGGRGPTMYWDTITDTVSNITNTGTPLGDFFEGYNVRNMINLDHEKLFVTTNDTKAWLVGQDGVDELGEVLHDRWDSAMFLVPRNYATCNTATS